MARPTFPAAAALLLAGATLGGADAPPARRAIDTALERLRDLTLARDQILAEQEAAWPTRKDDQAKERPAPAPVRRLQDAHRLLEREIAAAGIALERAATADPSPLFQALCSARPASLVETLLPITARLGRGNQAACEALLALARGQTARTPALLQAFADVDVEEASRFLFELGKEERRATLLTASAVHGDPGILAALIDLADGASGNLAAIGLDAVRRLTPPESRSASRLETLEIRRQQELRARGTALEPLVRLSTPAVLDLELTNLVRSRIASARSVELRAALTVYLGLFRDPGNLEFFTRLYSTSSEEGVRLAALSALGNLGRPSGDFLVGELAKGEGSQALRRGCLHALAAARYRPAIPGLLNLLQDPALRPEAARTLRRIAGQDLGVNDAAWRRWWRAQPDARPEDRDPEA